MMEKGNKILIAGPCSAESEEQVMSAARELAGMGVDIFRAGVWKPRTRPGGFEGVGAEALGWLGRAQAETGVPAAVEVANAKHLEEALNAGIEIFWIGARTAVNPFSVQEIADKLAGLPEDRKRRLTVLVKNPVNPDLELWIGGIDRIKGAGIGTVMAVHRGFSQYGNHIYRNDPKWAIPIELKRRMPELRVICDPSHIGGRRDLIASLSQEAFNMGFDGLMVEVHPSPSEALSDAGQQITPKEFGKILEELKIPGENLESEILEKLRRDIDAVDEELIALLARRMEISEEIGEYKRQRGMAVVQPERYRALMEKRVEEGEAMGLRSAFIRRVLGMIHEESVKVQNVKG